MFRSSRPEVFCKKGVTEKHLFQSLFLNKVAGQAWNFVKKETLAQVFSYEFYEISKNTFLIEQLWTTAFYSLCMQSLVAANHHGLESSQNKLDR